MDNVYKNTFSISGFVAKPIAIRPITAGRHSLVIVIKTKNFYGEDCFIRAVSYEKVIIDQAVNMGIGENHIIQIDGYHDVIKWEDNKSNTVKSRPCLVIQSFKRINSQPVSGEENE